MERAVTVLRKKCWFLGWTSCHKTSCYGNLNLNPGLLSGSFYGDIFFFPLNILYHLAQGLCWSQYTMLLGFLSSQLSSQWFCHFTWASLEGGGLWLSPPFPRTGWWVVDLFSSLLNAPPTSTVTGPGGEEVCFREIKVSSLKGNKFLANYAIILLCSLNEKKIHKPLKA